MTILFEEYHYETTQLKKLLSERFYVSLRDNSKSKITYVGYFFDTTVSESPVIVLPKVFFDENQKVFSKYNPTDFIDLSQNEILQDQLRAENKAEFLFSISTWLYLAIQRFNNRHQDNIISQSADLTQIGLSTGEQTITELEIVKSMIRFNHENRHLMTFIHKTNSSQQKQIDWSKTIQRRMAFVQENQPFYLETLNKQKTVNQDEELFVIFYSVLASFNRKYFLKIPLNPLFSTLSNSELSNFERTATQRLKRIKSKYFNDKLLKMWHLLYVYFERLDQIKSQKEYKEILMVRDFNIVFEDMIDSLLADGDLPQKLKEQNDGKIIDHIYQYNDLLTQNEDFIYHIADSKYYGANATVSKYDQAKQITYAKNVIQYNIDWLNEERNTQPIRYRDELTEGYNITPNFFISAFVDDSLDFNFDRLTFKQDFERNAHFKNRLFDRDTLILQHYNINFLFVLSSYIENDNFKKRQFAIKVKRKFREKLIIYLESKFDFYKITPKEESLSMFIQRNFRQLIGKVYCPSGWENELLLAVEKSNKVDISDCKIEEYCLNRN
jgi:hypothetical protein